MDDPDKVRQCGRERGGDRVGGRREDLEARDEDILHDLGVLRRELDGNEGAEAKTDNVRFTVKSLGADQGSEQARGARDGERRESAGGAVAGQVRDQEVVVGLEVGGDEGPFSAGGEGAVDEEDTGGARGVVGVVGKEKVG